jgi:hypothetical protein
MTCLGLMRVGFVSCMRVIRQQAEAIQFGGNYGFAMLQALQPINAAALHLNFSCQAVPDLAFRLGAFGFFRCIGTSIRWSQLTQPDGDLLGFRRVE